MSNSFQQGGVWQSANREQWWMTRLTCIDVQMIYVSLQDSTASRVPWDLIMTKCGHSRQIVTQGAGFVLHNSSDRLMSLQERLLLSGHSWDLRTSLPEAEQNQLHVALI